MDRHELNSLNPLQLAFIGDSVFELAVRERLLHESKCSVAELNKKKVKLVSCSAQAAMAAKLLPLLSDGETAVYKRGRNAKTNTVPRNAEISDYHSATGLEALFGYLYLSGNTARLHELIGICTDI